MTNKITKFLVSAVAALAIFGFATSASAYSYTTLLKLGSKGTQVMELQKTLNGSGFLVATTGAGAPGMESMTFGPKTKSAVMAFQAAKGLKADGVVGITTGTALSAMTGGSVAYPAGCTSTSGYSSTTGMPCTSTGNSNLPAGCMTTAGYSSTTGQACSGSSNNGSTNSGSLSGGETSISDVNLDDADDDSLNEGASKAPVASIDFNVDDADAQLTRADIVFQPGNSTEEEKPWRAFDKVYLMEGSTVIASMDSSNENAWDDASDIGGLTTFDAYRIRLTGINKVFKENSNPELWVAVDVNDSVDGSDSSSTAAWDVAIENNGLRFVDGAGVDTEEDAGSDVASFTIQRSGADSSISVTESDNSPSATALEVKTNASTTQTIGIFNVEADQDGQDVLLNDFPVTLTGSANLSTFIDDVYVVIDGKEYSADGSVNSSTSQTFRFNDIDDDNVKLDAGDDMDITVKVKFKSQQSGQSVNGTTVYASVLLTSADVEDADTGDNITDITSSASQADTFTIFSNGVSVKLNDSGMDPVITTTQDGLNNKLTYNLSFKVTSFGDTVYIPKGVVRGSANGSAGLAFTVENSNGTTNTSVGASAGSLQSSATTTNGYFKVAEGQTETFNVSISVTGGSGQYYHVQLGSVGFDLDQTGAVTTYTLAPDTDFDTNDALLQA